jgi:hypothetical protein
VSWDSRNRLVVIFPEDNPGKIATLTEVGMDREGSGQRQAH